MSNLPKEIYSKIIDVKSIVLGYASKQDKETLMAYADELYAKLEQQAEKANKITENAKTYLQI